MPYFNFPQINSEDYAEARPFPYIVLKNAWAQSILECAENDIKSFNDWDGERQFYWTRHKRFCSSMQVLPKSVQTIIQEASSPEFLRWLEGLTGEKALVPDPYLEGGGIHQISRGGFLKVHADFNWYPRLNLYRRINVLIYLNSGWNEVWGGDLQLFHDPDAPADVSVFPHINSMAIFTTDDASFHGHPVELDCPEDVTRNSIALYYYSAIKPAHNFSRSRKKSDYRAVPSDRSDLIEVWKGRIWDARNALLGRM